MTNSFIHLPLSAFFLPRRTPDHGKAQNYTFTCSPSTFHLPPSAFHGQTTGSVISQNGTSPSECQHSSCWYTKGQFGLKWPKHYIWAWPLMYFPQTILVYFYYEFWVAYTTMCIATRVSYARFALQPTYTCIREFPLSNSCVIRELPLLIPTYTLIRH